jgi:hypothetical protein
MTAPIAKARSSSSVSILPFNRLYSFCVLANLIGPGSNRFATVAACGGGAHSGDDPFRIHSRAHRATSFLSLTFPNVPTCSRRQLREGAVLHFVSALRW